MKLALFLLGLVILFLGILQLLKRYINVPLIPSEGIGYQLIISSTGILAIIAALVGLRKDSRNKL